MKKDYYYDLSERKKKEIKDGLEWVKIQVIIDANNVLQQVKCLAELNSVTISNEIKLAYNRKYKNDGNNVFSRKVGKDTVLIIFTRKDQLKEHALAHYGLYNAFKRYKNSFHSY